MAQPKISAIRYIELDVPDLEPSVRFYEEAWCLTPIARDGGSVYFRATGPEHHALVLHQSAGVAVAGIGFAAPDKAAVDALHARIQGRGISVVSPPAPLARPGGGYGFSFRHWDGWTFTISSDMETHDDTGDAIDRPRRLSHVALHSERADEAVAFFVDHFGFKVSDRTDAISFMRCAADHHSFAFVNLGAASVHHVSYEMPGFDALMRGAGRMKEMGYPLEWGIGRHGPGDNIFSYFIEPHGFVNEYTAEMLQVDDSYPYGPPEKWRRSGNRWDEWAFSGPPSEAMNEAGIGTLLPAA